MLGKFSKPALKAIQSHEVDRKAERANASSSLANFTQANYPSLFTFPVAYRPTVVRW
jgi:hypothetical protein